MITVRHWKRTFPNAKEEDRILINMYVQIDSKIWQKLTRPASTLWTPQGLRRLTLWLQLGKAWWDTPTVPALGRQKQEHHCKFEASPGLYGECQDTESHWYRATEKTIRKTLVCGLYEHQQPHCPKCADGATPPMCKHRPFPEAQKRPWRLAWRWAVEKSQLLSMKILWLVLHAHTK